MKKNNESHDNMYTVAYISDLFCANIYTNVYLKRLKGTIDNEIVSEIILEFIQYYIERGGFSEFEFDDDIYVSSNILMLMNIKKAFINSEKKDLITNIKKALKNGYDESKKNRSFGSPKLAKDLLPTEMEIENIKLDDEYTGNKNSNYNSDICVMTMLVGLYYSAEDELENLIDISIKISRLTHNNINGILAGITSAYFISLAVREIDIMKWVFLLIKLLESNLIKKHLDLDDTRNMIEYINYLRHWQIYRDSKFNEGKINKLKSDSSLVFKWKNYKKYKSNESSLFEDAISCLVISYDSLLECDGKFEKIIYYALLLPGLTMTIGAFVGALYGLVYGINNVPKFMTRIALSA
jgi:ADP-ribosylglycohydrolase